MLIATYKLLFENSDSLDIHLDALENLVMLRGGIDELEITNPRLAMIVNLSDIFLASC